MNTINIFSLNNIIFKNTTRFGNTITKVNIENTLPNYKNFDLEMYDKKDNSSPIAQLFSTISKNQIFIIDFCSTYENEGNGKQLLINLFECIKIINIYYSINSVSGFLSSVDYHNWKKLIHMYISIEKFLKNIHYYKNNDIPFILELTDNFFK